MWVRIEPCLFIIINMHYKKNLYYLILGFDGKIQREGSKLYWISDSYLRHIHVYGHSISCLVWLNCHNFFTLFFLLLLKNVYSCIFGSFLSLFSLPVIWNTVEIISLSILHLLWIDWYLFQVFDNFQLVYICYYRS